MAQLLPTNPPRMVPPLPPVLWKPFLVLLITAILSAAQDDLDSVPEDDIIAVNTGLEVPFGRAVFVDPERHLKIQVRDGDRCTVRVVQSDPLSQGPGRLTPTTFPCDFGPEDVQYSHFGARSPTQDRVKMLLRYDTHDDTIIIPFSLEVQVLFDQQEVVTRNAPITVDRLNGMSTPIDSRGLQFTYDRDNHVCKVTILSPSSGLPRYGIILNESAVGVMHDCDDFLQANLRYQHTASTNSPNRDYIPMVVEVMDREGNLFKQEYFQVTVRIRDGQDNAPPIVSFSALLLMDVNQFVMTAITPNILQADDVETPPENLIFNITTPLNFGEGHIVSTDDQNLPITSFYQKDVQDLKIAYKPPASDSDVRRIFTVEMEVVDSEGLASDPFTLMIVVNPMNTLAPVATRNTGISLFEGQSRRLQSNKNLEISDEDNMDNVILSVADGLRHGQLLLMGMPVKQFSPADLDAGLVIYQHDGTDTYSDNIIFRMTDGEHEVEFLFPITVFPEDDEPPVLNVNTGLVLHKGEEAEISPFVLSATDVDSDDAYIQFTLEEPLSVHGELLMRQLEDPDDPQFWHFENGIFERPVTEWTQQDLNEGRIFYRHTGEHNSDAVMDIIRFRVSDNNEPPNESDVHEFIIKILPVDDLPPDPHEAATFQMTVDEFEVTDITRQYLRYTDLDSNDRHLRFTILIPPFDTDPNNPSEAGRIVFSEDPEHEMTVFTQAQVNHHKIAYKPPPVELGLTPRVIQFEFQVEDEAGNILPGQVFTILLQPVDNKPPTVLNTGFRAFENGYVTLHPGILDATDPDTDLDLIIFRVVEAPKHGTLQYHLRPMTAGDEFGRGDIIAGQIAYINSGAEMDRDDFKLEVTDGVHKVPVTIRVTVKPVDDEAPKLIQGGTLGAHLEVPERGNVTITSGTLKASDPDTDALMLTFIVENSPRFGEILVNGRPVDRFTQQQIENNEVTYVHLGGEIGRDPVNDSFNLSLSDMSDEWIIGGNRVNQVQINVTIEPVDSVPPDVTVGQVFHVKEGKKRTITTVYLSASDSDSEEDDLICTILVQPMQGYVENISPAPGSERSRAGISVTAFTIGDVKKGYINYVQSIHKGIEPREDRFTFQCSDGVNLSPRHFFTIAVDPTNDEIPELFMREFVVMEGMDLSLDLPILNAIDLDEPKDTLTFRVTVKPEHGRIIQQAPSGTIEIDTFTLDQISEGSTIAYSHDDSETLEDKFEMELTDGNVNHTVKKEFLVMVIPVDDETPRLTINDGLEIKIGETAILTNRVLKAEDLDSEDANLTFIVRLPPRHGFLVRIDADIGEPLFNFTRGMNFTQTDIDNEVIQYIHTGQEGVRDLIKFDVTDGFNPLIDRYFYVTVEGTDLIYPDVVNKGVELPEGGRVTLTTDILSTSDLNSEDEMLTFSITRAPHRGHLENTDHPGVPITSFTQLQLAGNKIYYTHTSVDEMKMDSFEFEVTDGYNSVFRTFRISLSDVDNKKPILFIGDLLVKENGRRLITPFELKVEDRDTADHLLRFVITQVPVHGSLLYNNSKPASSFTMADLNENLISYHHDGSETLDDSFSFVITDGTHVDFFVFPNIDKETRRPQTMRVEIVPVDNGIPQIAANRGSSAIGPLEDGTLGFRFTNKVLRAEDRDSPDQFLMYVITEQPQYGYIINSANGNHSVKNFTQGDIDKMDVYYIIKDNINATSDMFHFKVIDKGGNELTNQNFRFNWAWISFEFEKYSINETEKYLKINLKRRGYLGETSFVGITTKDLSAKKGKDFHKTYAKQVQFNPGQTEALWRLRIMQDEIYERGEQLELILEEPVMAALEFPDKSIVTILDEEDESTVYIPNAKYKVEEDIGELLIPVQRNGDISEEMMVICSTNSGTATGTIPSTVLSFSDYISRAEDHTSLVRFDRDQSMQVCRIVIIDDSLFEEDETFKVKLSVPMGGKLGKYNETEVTILPDVNDVPSFYFGESFYHADESDGYVEVMVWRTGTDLSKPATVTVRSKPSDPPSAEVGYDYVGIGKNLDFAPGVTMQTLRVTILDDLGQPHQEGLETFELVLNMPMNAVLGEPSQATITINDTVSDLPKMQFKEPVYSGHENDGFITTKIVRSGDLNLVSTVRCYTRQAVARVVDDFQERPDTDDSIITFQPGEMEQECTVILVDDIIHEGDEEFRMVLGSPNSTAPGGAVLGLQNDTKLIIKDGGDKPVIKFEQTRFNVKEPKEHGDIAIVQVPVIRIGDLSQTSVVRVHTKDGSAKAGEDYNGLSQEITFGANKSRHIIEVEILYDGDKEHREAFTIHLKPDKHMVADIKDHKAIIYIQEMDIVADVTFPSPPIVVSLRDYDDATHAQEHPVPGYPVVCITPCNPKHPDYAKTGALCTKEGINDSLTEFRWRVAAPSGQDGVTSDLKDVESNTFFSSTRLISLDSIYFSAGSRVQCAARAVNLDGDSGLELLSAAVTISAIDGICTPRVLGSFGAEPFTAKMRYTGPDDPDHPNLIRLSIIIPHRDGMLPIISTRPLSNFELTLSPDGTRVGNHKCSNLLDVNEVQTKYGFLSEATKNANVIGEVEPYQYSAELRSDPALRFYRNLDLEACMWEFTSYYDMSELITECGGVIGTDGQVLNLIQSFVSVRIPLYVSYIFHSPVATGGWQHNDLTSQLRLTFVYDTAILWQHGIGAPEESQLQGYLYPTSMRIRDDGRLVVNFRTEARFRGTFVITHPSSNVHSMVMSRDQGDLTFTLELIRIEPTFAQPEQEWQFVSDYAVRDYSGMYNIKLVPCTVSEDVAYSVPLVCNPRDPINFDLQIRFQQVSDPVPAEFSLNTQFLLMRKRELWLSDGSMGFGEDSDVSFQPGDLIYGRIMVDPIQNLGHSFHMTVEKCFLCTGVDGYIPKYDPDNNEYGCVADSPNLLHNFKVIDKGAPNTVQLEFRSVPFNAVLAVDDTEATDVGALVRQAGSDGFRLNSSPLFQVSYGRQWFIHCIYTVRSKENAARGIGKRSITERHVISSMQSRVKRALEDTDGVGNGGRGTNMHRIRLDYGTVRRRIDFPFDESGDYETGFNERAGDSTLSLMPILLVIIACLLVITVVTIFVIQKRKRGPKPPLSNTVTIVANGRSRVIDRGYLNSNSENTEV